MSIYLSIHPSGLSRRRLLPHRHHGHCGQAAQALTSASGFCGRVCVRPDIAATQRRLGEPLSQRHEDRVGAHVIGACASGFCGRVEP